MPSLGDSVCCNSTHWERLGAEECLVMMPSECCSGVSDVLLVYESVYMYYAINGTSVSPAFPFPRITFPFILSMWLHVCTITCLHVYLPRKSVAFSVAKSLLLETPYMMSWAKQLISLGTLELLPVNSLPLYLSRLSPLHAVYTVIYLKYDVHECGTYIGVLS